MSDRHEYLAVEEGQFREVKKRLFVHYNEMNLLTKL